jgi:hypothetical protein
MPIDSSIIEFFIRIGAALLELCGIVHGAQEDMTTGSRLGESRMDRESRQWFRRLSIVVSCITLVLLIVWAVMEWRA